MTNLDWAWKDKHNGNRPISKKPSSNSRGKNKKRRARISRKDNEGFYSSREWQELRVRVLEKFECKCMMCGRSPRYHNVVLNVDHIKPRRTHPELALCFDNLQVLCGACNRGKGNKFQTDYRPKIEEIDEMLDNAHLASIPAHY